jgi:regulator of ribonuclease activity A
VSDAETTWTTPDLCDEHDEVRVVDGDLRDYGGRERFGGPVVTARCHDADGPDNTLVKELCSTPGEGRVLVVDAGGLRTHAVLGDLIAAEAVAHGWAGVVVHGVVRDLELLRTMDLGVRALGACPRRSVRRGVGERDVPVRLGSVVVSPGDHLYADATGVVVAAGPLV